MVSSEVLRPELLLHTSVHYLAGSTLPSGSDMELFLPSLVNYLIENQVFKNVHFSIDIHSKP